MYQCPECEGSDVKIIGPPITIHFDAEGPVAFEYEDNPIGSIDDSSPAQCVACGHSAFAREFGHGR